MAMLSEILEENKSERLSDKSKSDKRQPSDQSDSSSKKQKDRIKPRFNDLDDVQVVDPSIKPVRDNMEESKSLRYRQSINQENESSIQETGPKQSIGAANYNRF